MIAIAWCNCNFVTILAGGQVRVREVYTDMVAIRKVWVSSEVLCLLPFSPLFADALSHTTSSVWWKLQVAKGGQGAYVSSKVRMGIACHSGLLFILFLVVCNYKHGSQIIVQHYIVNDVKWSHYIANDAMRRHYIAGDAMWSFYIATDVTRRHYITVMSKGSGRSPPSWEVQGNCQSHDLVAW